MAGSETENGKDMILVERERYESLLIELGELRKTTEFLSDYKAALLEKDRELKEKERELEEIKEILLETEWKDYELEHTQKLIRELENEIRSLKANRPWWKRIFD
jgi:hypothetical protein